MGKRRSVSAPLVIAGLIAFVLVDLALVFFALNPPAQAGSGGSAASTPIPTFTTQPSATGAPTPTVSATPIPTATSTAPPPPTPTPSASGTALPSATPSASAATLQGFADSQVGYRATPGSCTGTDAVIELTTDGGTTWSDVTPSEPRIREVDSIVVVDSDHVDLLAKYGDACTLSDVSTYTQGQFWQAYPDRTAQLQNQ